MTSLPFLFLITFLYHYKGSSTYAFCVVCHSLLIFANLSYHSMGSKGERVPSTVADEGVREGTDSGGEEGGSKEGGSKEGGSEEGGCEGRRDEGGCMWRGEEGVSWFPSR